MIHAGKESTSLSSNELSPRSATLIRKHWGRGRRSQNWVNCRQVKRRERGKQTGENSHVQTLRVNDKESFLLSSRDYPDSRCSCAGLHCIQQIALSSSFQLSRGSSTDYMLCRGIQLNFFDTREMPDRSRST